MYLLDTIIISELRRPRPHAGLIAWLSGIAPDQVFISAVTLGELRVDPFTEANQREPPELSS